MMKKIEHKVAIVVLLLIVITLCIGSWSTRAYIPTITTITTLNFGTTLPGTSSDLTVTVTGASVGDAVVLGVPNGSMPSNGGFMGWISGTNQASIRFFNNDLTNTFDPPSGSFKLIVVKQ